MSDTQVQETEAVTGAIVGINQKRADTWQVEVQPPGSNYTKKLWTKNPELVASLTREIGSTQTFQCNASYWTNNEGKQVRSLWISSLGGEVAAPAVATASPAQPSPSHGVRSQDTPDVDWDEKERRAIRSKAWAHTISLFGQVSTLNSAQEIATAHSHLKLMVELIYADICRSHTFAHPHLGDGVPFGEEPVDVPFD